LHAVRLALFGFGHLGRAPGTTADAILTDLLDIVAAR
jgi:hypothetical protein